MAEHNLLGKKGEEIAQQYLVSHGFKIIATNWLFNHKEIDIIAWEGEILVFVEVKTYGSDIEEGLPQLKSYMSNEKTCSYGVVTNGCEMVVLNNKFEFIDDI